MESNNKNNQKENNNEKTQTAGNEEKNIIKNKAAKGASKKKPNRWIWPVKILVITLFLSLAISMGSEMALSNAGIAVSCVVIVLLLVISVFADMIGVAVAAADIEPFTAMCSRKVRGAQQAMFLIKNAEKVGSICNDVIGDVCGILCGAAGAAIALKLTTISMSSALAVLIASAVSAVIAGLTIFGKAIFKKYAIDNSTKIMLGVGKFLALFSKKSKNK